MLYHIISTLQSVLCYFIIRKLLADFFAKNSVFSSFLL